MSNISLKNLILRNNYLQNLKNGTIQHFKSFKNNLTEKAACLKKNAAPRIMALMLAGTTLASMTACDEIGGSKNIEHGELFNQACQVEVVDGVKLDDITPDNYYNYINEIYKQYPYGPIPYNFLREKGVLPLDESGKPIYDNTKVFETYIMIDESSEENDVRMIVVCGDYIIEENSVWYTWELKYVLEDSDYKDLILLCGNDDIKILDFIRGVEEKYNYETLSTNVMSGKLRAAILNWNKTRSDISNGTVTSVNSLTGEVRFRYLTMYDNFVKDAVYTLNIKDGGYWDYNINKGCTEEEILNGMFPIIETPHGKGYGFNWEFDTFDKECIHNVSGSAPYESVGEYKLIQGSTDIDELYQNNDAAYSKVLKEFDEQYNEGKERASKYYKEIELGK